MHHFQPLFVERATVQMPGLRILTFALHRHKRDDAAIESHRHRWSQVILYLGGQGRQVFADRSVPIEPGTAVILPPGSRHAFVRVAARAPLCLAIDFHLEGEQEKQESVCRVTRSELLRIRGDLARLLKFSQAVPGELPLDGATVVLQVLLSLLRDAGWLGRAQAPVPEETNHALHQLLSRMDPTVPLLSFVRGSGYSRDHLNRLVKKETGLTLGQLRDQQRLAKAKELLSEGFQVGNAAAIVGLPDQSYFARWFRRQTGQPPSRWMTCRMAR